MDNYKSKHLYDKACAVMPGGVSSPVRAFGAVGGTPLVIESAQGANIQDVNGNTYLDFVGSWGPNILGHAHPGIVEAVSTAAEKGLTYGALHVGEIDLASEVINAYPGIEQVRFVSSGTEATMSAIRLARGYTGRDIIIKFEGCYHGHADHLLVSAGSGLATFGTPSSKGVPDAFASLTKIISLDDEAGLEHVFNELGDQIAAVIIEPIPANNGLLLQRREFLECLRQCTKDSGALLIFDEVISGFRVAKGGAAEYYGITPDMATFGKVIGGGMPVGAFGASHDIMSHLAPLGGVYQAGTLSGNPVAMSAGLATLGIMNQSNAWSQLEKLGTILDQEIEKIQTQIQTDPSLAFSYSRVGSIFWLCFQEGEAPRAASDIQAVAEDAYSTVFHGLLERGISLAPSAYEVGFISMAHTEEDIRLLGSSLLDVLHNSAQ